MVELIMPLVALALFVCGLLARRHIRNHKAACCGK